MDALSGDRVSGCWVMRGATVAVVFLDGDIAQVPVVFLPPGDKREALVAVVRVEAQVRGAQAAADGIVLSDGRLDAQQARLIP